VEIEPATRRRLLDDPTVAGYVDGKGFTHRLHDGVDVGETGGRAFVVRRVGGWATPDPVTSQEYPLLSIDCYAGDSRDAGGNITAFDATSGAFALWRTIDAVLHAPERGTWWGAIGSNPGLLVVTSQRWGEPFAETGSALLSARASTGEVLGEHATLVSGRYAIQCAHTQKAA
jgi:hypothetical protein